MKSFQQYISESILDDEDELAMDNSALLSQYIVDTYYHINKSKLKVRYVDGEDIVTLTALGAYLGWKN